ncbi:M56 family metallopeptidase [Flavobacterium sp. ARAG 55.4]|uniref:M56 family metallopeptidase n=1 Tax=Flavobacterium sp. ARAG 55.4 TaxID=3451357 RepID=UPI003F44777C
MENLFLYFIKASGLIGLFYLAYMLLLRKETFFTANRWFLLSGLFTSALLPLYFITKIIWIEPTTDSFDWSNIPLTANTTAIQNTTITAIQKNTFEMNWQIIFGIVYSIGILVFLIKFIFDFYSLSKILKGKSIQHHNDFKFIDVTENIAPFSYFKSIVYNSDLYTPIELENILEHEKVHSSQHHSVDVLAARMFCIAFWFNPLIWLYKKAMVQNLEFIADNEASKNIFDKKNYQLTLLKITTQENCVAISNHFYQSLIKKRIIMLNKNQSNKMNSWKFAAVLPLLGVFLFLFQVKVVAEEKVTSTEKKEPQSAKVETKIVESKNDSDTLSKEKEIGTTVKKDIEKTDVSRIESTINTTTKREKPIASYLKDYYIDGAKSTYKEYGKLDLNNIEVEAKPFEKRVKVTTIKTGTQKSTINTEEDKKQGKNSTLITIDDGTPPFYYDYDKALVILDGKESDYNTVLQNKDKELKFVYATYFKYTPDENKRIVLAQFGEKARNGVFIIETNSYQKK